MYDSENPLLLGCSRNGTKLENTSLSTGVCKRFSCIIHIYAILY